MYKSPLNLGTSHYSGDWSREESRSEHELREKDRDGCCSLAPPSIT